MTHSDTDIASIRDKYDKEMAYTIFIIEKEFNVGLIDENFPAMKLFNLMDKYNLDRYKNDTDTKSSNGMGGVKTLG